MPNLSYPATLTAHTTAAAADVQGNFDAVKTLLNTTGLDATNFQTGIVVNATVATAAAIDYSKLATLTAGNVVLGNSSNVATSTAVTGDIGITSSGVTSISSGVIVNADVNASAAIAYPKLNLTGALLNADVSTSAAIAVSKLAAGTSAQVLLNTATPTPTWTTLAGDVTVGATGTTAIGASKVTNAMLDTNAVTLGYAEITSTFSYNSATPVQITGLTSTVTIPSGTRPIVVEAFVPAHTNGVADVIAINLWDGTVGTTQIQRATQVQGNTSRDDFLYIKRVLSGASRPSAGSKTYNVGINGAGATNGNVTAASTGPAFIQVSVQ